MNSFNEMFPLARMFPLAVMHKRAQCNKDITVVIACFISMMKLNIIRYFCRIESTATYCGILFFLGNYVFLIEICVCYDYFS